MKKTKLALFLGIVFSLLLGPSLVGIQPSYAHRSIDCETERFNAFMGANDQYTSTFRSWYFGLPVSCQQQCAPTCNPISDPYLKGLCFSNCITSCDNSRYSSFTTAQNALVSAASEPCPHDPDYCAQAFTAHQQCIATYFLHWENPVYDENGNIDGTWLSFVADEVMACRTASGIDNCQ